MTVDKKILEELKRSKTELYLDVAKYLKRPRRSKKGVNLLKLNRVAKSNEKIIVPSKVLGTGVMTKKIDVYAHEFSSSAREKIESAGGKCGTLHDMVKEKIKGRIIL